MPDTGQPLTSDRLESLEAHARMFGALDLLSVPIWIYDFDHRCIAWANASALAVWNARTLSELCARDLGADMSLSVSGRLQQYRSDFESQGLVFNEQWTLYPAGKPISLNVRLSGIALHDGRLGMLSEGSLCDSMRPESLRSVEALLHTGVMISLYDDAGVPLYRNPSARASVRAPNERLDQRLTSTQAHETLMGDIERDGIVKRTLLVHTVQGERWHELSARHCLDAVTGGKALLVSEVDVTAIKHAEAQAQYLALRDPLTGLANRAQLFQTFGESVPFFRDMQLQAALMFIDLDHFKNVNDSFGHAAGDALLSEIAQRLQRNLPEALLIARLGGDEFLILVAAEDVTRLLPDIHRKLRNTISSPTRVFGHDLRISPSIGVSLFPSDGEDVETLLRHADLAMYAAKDRGRNELAYYDTRMSESVMTRIELEANLRQALEDGSLSVHYQPMIETRSGKIVGAEALARWEHPRHGTVPPDIFIPIAESSGLIRQLGMFVFCNAARQQAAWARAGHALRVSVNLSTRQLRDDDLLADLEAAITSSQADPRMLHIEITESMLLGRDEALLERLRRIEGMGFRIALDDFGTGYSNLGYLQHFPIHEIKIDKSFIQSIDVNRPLAELIVSMCKLMQLTSVAEGVETPEQLEWIRSKGIEYCQGFLFSRALPAQGFEALLDRNAEGSDIQT